MNLDEALAANLVLTAFPGSTRCIPIELDYGPMKRCGGCWKPTMTRDAGNKALCYACAGW